MQFMRLRQGQRGVAVIMKWIEEITIEELQKKIENKEITSGELVLEYMKRVALFDKAGPELNSLFEWNPDALAIAEAMDRERNHGKIRSGIHGIPVVLKANISTKDMMRTPAGSIALADNYAPYDAHLVKRLREAGAVIMGKTNMTEMAGSVSRKMPRSYSSLGNHVRNPYTGTTEVGGSSNGSAVAVSANLSMLAVGTETNGSIIRPSCMNGVVGIKPTIGLVSRYGVMPICTSQDTAGPIARTVKDAAILLNYMAGEDMNDPTTWERQDDKKEDYSLFCQEDGLTGMKIGINRGYWHELSEEQKTIAEKAFQLMQESGAVIKNQVNRSHLKCDTNVFLYEYMKCTDWYLSTMGNIKCKSLQEMYDFYMNHSKNDRKYGMDYITDALFSTSGTCTDAIYLKDKLEALRISRQDGIDQLLDENDLDLLVCPGVTDLSPISGYPSIVVPAGYESSQMPFGISFVGRAFSENILIQAAYSFEQKMKARKAPEL